MIMGRDWLPLAMKANHLDATSQHKRGASQAGVLGKQDVN